MSLARYRPFDPTLEALYGSVVTGARKPTGGNAGRKRSSKRSGLLGKMQLPAEMLAVGILKIAQESRASSETDWHAAARCVTEDSIVAALSHPFLPAGKIQIVLCLAGRYLAPTVDLTEIIKSALLRIVKSEYSVSTQCPSGSHH